MERNKLMKNVKKEYETQLNKIKERRKQIVYEQKKEGEYRIGNKKKEKRIKKAIEKIKKDFKVLLIERIKLDEDYERKKENIGKVFLKKGDIQKQREIFDKISRSSKFRVPFLLFSRIL